MSKQLKSIEDLKPAPYNDEIREMSEAAAKGLGKSIEDFGDLSGITWNQRTGNLVCGHKRVEQLKAKGAKFKGKALVLNGDRFPIRVVDWDKKKEFRANVAANNKFIAGEFSGGLNDRLGEIKADLPDEDFELLRFDVLAESIEGLAKEKEVVEDEVPEPSKKPITKLGDVWKLGKHTVVCGDCINLKSPKNFDLLVTDPPYGVSYSDKNKFLNSIDEGCRNQTKIENDYLSLSGMAQFWEDGFKILFERAKPGACYYMTGPQGGDLSMMMMMQRAGWLLKHVLIWVKNNHVLGRCDYNYKHEPILYGWKPGAAHCYLGGFDTSVWEISRSQQSKEHPTMKPVQLFAKCIKNGSRVAEVVVDPFLGSGTTLIAAEQLDRICYGIEIEPAYCDVVVERWENLTGKKAKRNAK